MRRAALGLATLALAAVALALPACGESFTAASEVVRSATVSVGRATTFVVDSPVPLLVTGVGRSTDVVYELTGVMTASTASVATELAEAVALSVETLDPQGIQLVFENAEPRNGRLQGELRIWLPDDMDVVIFGNGGTVDVDRIEGNIDVNAIGQTRVLGAVGSVSVGVEAGAALVQTSALPGTVVDLRTRGGDIVLELPTRVSAQIVASAGGMGQIAQRHPNLPPYVGGGFDYVTTVGGGLSDIRLTTGSGNIFIQVAP